MGKQVTERVSIQYLHAYHGFYHLKQIVQLHLQLAVQHQLGSAHMAAWNGVPPAIFCLH